MPEHFAAPPQWGWYIIGYFFLGGISGGAYALGVMLRLVGGERDREAARVAFRLCFPLLVICAVLLTLDLGQPTRFWHMLIDRRTGGIGFKYWSPMSVGAWALLLFGVFAFISFLGARAKHPSGRGVERFLNHAVGRAFQIAGALVGLFIAGYTGVLLSVSNQPVWSDTWTLGGLFLASGLSAAAAAILLGVLRSQPAAGASVPKLSEAERYFILLELVLLVLFFWTLGRMAPKTLGWWIPLWLVVLAGTVIPLVMQRRPTVARQRSALLAPVLVLLGSLALRTVIVFSAQS